MGAAVVRRSPHPSLNALLFIGKPPHVGFLALYAFALASGLFAAFGQVTLRLWTREGGNHRDPQEAPQPRKDIR